MKTTVITICWDGARSIERCIRSVIKQTVVPAEYIFVDGGSTDGTLDIIASLIPEMKEVGIMPVLLQQQRVPGEAGIPSAWNQGIAKANGDVIALLNCDDYYEPDAIERMQQEFEESPEIELLAGSIRMVDSNCVETRLIYPKCLCWSEVLMPLAHPACFVTRKLYDRIGLYDTAYRISADYDFVWRCRCKKAKIQFDDKIYVNMEMGGLANSNRAAARKETLEISLKYSKFSLLPRLAYLCRKFLGR